MLPVRDGVGASQVGLPEGPWACMLDFLVQRFPAIPAAQWRERMARGDVVDEAGRRITPGEPYTAHGKLYYYRSVPDEEPSAAPVSVLFEDELLVVADKPHFLSVTPSGHYLQQTLLVQLRLGPLLFSGAIERATGADVLTADGLQRMYSTILEILRTGIYTGPHPDVEEDPFELGRYLGSDPGPTDHDSRLTTGGRN